MRFALFIPLLMLFASCAPIAPTPVEAPAPRTHTAPVDTVSQELREEILAMDAAAEEVRSELADPGLTDEEFEEVSARLRALERTQETRLDEVIGAEGWPDARRVGGDASHAALVIILRSRNADLQARALDALETAFARGDTPGEPLAMLTDRIRLGRGEPQLYGTQISIDDQEVSVGPLEDPERVDERRAALGLMPLAEYLDLVRGMFD